jgi:coenzyme Q-binding protein COQ10
MTVWLLVSFIVRYACSSHRLSPIMPSYAEHLHMKYTPQQLFDLVADVERYPEFLPWIIAARVRRRDHQTVWVDMTVGTSILSKQFSTVASLDPPHRIHISSRDPLFEEFEQTWTFEQATAGGTIVVYRVDVQFRSRLLQAIIGAAFVERAAPMVAAFRRRARLLYGAPPADVSP